MAKKMLTPEQFNKLPREEKAVLVAKDVLERIKGGMLKVQGGRYITGVRAVKGAYFASHAPAKEVICNNEMKCEVCARGGLFISAVAFKNKLEFRNINGFGFDYGKKSWVSEKTEFLSDVFSRRQQSLIECAFETSEAFGEGFASKEDRQAACKYGRDLNRAYIRTPKEKRRVRNIAENRLRRIMLNIIRNKGTFVVPAKYYSK